MPLGLRNAPDSFQRRINVILPTVRWQIVLVSLYSVEILSRSPRKYIGHVRKVVTVLHNIGVMLKLKKYRSSKETINYLGHFISSGSLKIATHTTDAITELKETSKFTGRRSCLGLCNVLRRFVPNFSPLAAPSTARLQKDQRNSFGLFI